MANYELIVRKEDGVGERFIVPPEGVVIGRGVNCGIRLNDSAVSRSHARIWIEKGILQVEDMLSRNGVQLNDAMIKQAPMKEGDRLIVGESELLVAQETDSQLEQTLISSENAHQVHDAIMEENKGGRLPVLYKAAELLGEIFDLDELLHRILQLVSENLPVQRGFIIIRGQESDEPEIHASLFSEDQVGGPPLSHTLIQHVFDQKEAILTLDAHDDSRFNISESVMDHEIHVAMCAPLCGRSAVIGAIYVDSGLTHHAFSKADLELLTAVSQVVGVAVENAQLYQENILKERLAAVGEATAGVGHCVKNILTAIRGGGEFIGMALEKEDLKYLKRGWPILSRSIDRIEMLVMNMLTLSKERVPDRAPMDLNGLILEVIHVMKQHAERSKVVLRFESKERALINADMQQIYRVLMNLVMNAIEACQHKGGEVTLGCSCRDSGCYITVADTGMGIPSELLPKLAQAFVSSKGSSGTGLGLACSYKIVEEHEGSIEVKSTVGVGTTFTIFLPMEPVPGRPTVQASAH